MKVIVNGAKGRMGLESVIAINAEPDMKVVAELDRMDNLKDAIDHFNPDVVLDFTTPDVVMENCLTILNGGSNALVGTTGLSDAQQHQLHELALEKNLSVLICPNFAIGAVLMMKFAAEASKYLSQVEIIEYHHNQKLDAPSGTALKTADLIASANPDVNSIDSVEETELVEGVRGGERHRIPIHSVRLPGYVASQKVILGGVGQTLTLAHDTIHRNSFMPGVVLAIRQIKSFTGLQYGLETVL